MNHLKHLNITVSPQNEVDKKDEDDLGQQFQIISYPKVKQADGTAIAKKELKGLFDDAEKY